METGSVGWSHFLREPAKVDLPMQRTIHHEDAERWSRLTGQNGGLAK